MRAWQTKFNSKPLVFSAASSWVIIDRLLAPCWRQVGSRVRTARVPPLSTHTIHTLARASAGLSRSARALLTPLMLRQKPSGTSNSTPQPRAPPAELAGDGAGGSSEVG